MPFDLEPPPKLITWEPDRPAVVREAPRSTLRNGVLPGLPVAAGGAAPEFDGGDVNYDSVYAMLQDLAAHADSEGVQVGGTLTINGESLGSYDYVIKDGDQTISSFIVGDWLTATEDSRFAFIVVKGDLTINAGQVLTPSVRKLGLAIYVTGNLTVNGEISMSRRGANHTADDGNVSAAAIRIANGTFSGVSDPQVPAAGAGGGSGNGAAGANGSAGQTGGGGSGAFTSGTSGAGAAGSSFSGGPGGGAGNGDDGEDGEANGGKGGDGVASGRADAGGGAGNPGGQGADAADPGADGTGGILLIAVAGTYSGSGSVTANGAPGGGGTATQTQGGGGSGGGSITILTGSDSGPTPAATGGLGGSGDDADGGNGGNGTARKLAL